jgi:hypothetical protein
MTGTEIKERREREYHQTDDKTCGELQQFFLQYLKMGFGKDA